ncbi:MAG: hypothetical protein AB8F78_04150 [Saprospiraceae bacterium]
MSKQSVSDDESIYRKVSTHPERWDVALNQPKAIAFLPVKKRDPKTRKVIKPNQFEDGVSVDVKSLIVDLKAYAESLKGKAASILVEDCTKHGVKVVHDAIEEGNPQFELTGRNPAHALLIYENPRDYTTATLIAQSCVLVDFDEAKS